MRGKAMIRESVYDGDVEFLDSAYLPEAARLVKIFYRGLVEDGFPEEKIAIVVRRFAISLATQDDFTSRGGLMDAVEHGLRVILLNFDGVNKRLALMLAEYWALAVPPDMIVETGGIYSLNRECVPPATKRRVA